MLLCMEQRAEDSWIYLMPAVVYAAANQKGARSWMNRQKQEKIDLWNEKGIAWMRRYPVFWSSLDGNNGATRFWQREFLSSWKRNPWTSLKKEKIRFAIFTGKLGISLEAYAAVRQAECAGMERNESAVEGFCADGLRDVRHPFIDGTASEKELEERDRLCVGFMKLQQFTQESLRTNGIAAKQSAKVSGAEPVDACGTEIRSVGVGTNPTALVESEKMGWLFQKFRNPERPAYIHEKGRISSEWLEQLHQIMELAGLPAGTFEAVSLSVQEVNGLVNLMGEKLTARQYMTFLMLYSVSRELAQAGRMAAALQFIQTSRLRGAPPAAMGTGMTAAALMSGGAGAMVAERSRYGVRKMSDADGNLVSAEQPALYTQSVPQASQNSY